MSLLVIMPLSINLSNRVSQQDTQYCESSKPPASFIRMDTLGTAPVRVRANERVA